ncbi:Rne/Rng family ribonuclease [Portibacter lacus]|uniref:Ribonuclease G n=1 Tax=Portibacter lacus TaxID=1099794 RepID=A0AA37SQU1_9BACT|nr:Rne/Rng family ribonuclease [Portibacter lacus]GLR17949.1 ribonuclease G [Portibacter lacus]
MQKDLIIDVSPSKVDIALLEEGKLVELHKQKADSNFTVGDIFLGSIKKTMPGLNAAFVDIGHRKDAFLHYTDLGPQLKSLNKFVKETRSKKQTTHLLDQFEKEKDIFKSGKIDQVLKKRDLVLVQVLKEPISTKGPRLTCEITIPGRFVVLTPFYNNVSVSKKVSNPEERKRLHTLVESIKPKNFGIIIRTAAEGKKVADLHEEISGLMETWKGMWNSLKTAKVTSKLVSELDKSSSILRDILSDSFSKVVVNDMETYETLKTFLETSAPKLAKILSLYKSNKPIYDTFGVSRQIKSSFGKTSTMSSGAYLVIEHTEAMHVIDVNSGPKMQRKDQETSALMVNMESAKEIARQLRLRDIGGIILIDFIDMRKQENKVTLYKAMKDYMEGDRAQHTILPLSKFGLMQITRQRTRPEVSVDTSELCPTCQGSGKVNSTVLITDDIDRDLNYIMTSRPKSKVTLHVHPFVYAYLKKGIKSHQRRWYFKYSRWVKLVSEFEFGLNQYVFYDNHDDEIRLD